MLRKLYTYNCTKLLFLCKLYLNYSQRNFGYYLYLSSNFLKLISKICCSPVNL